MDIRPHEIHGLKMHSIPVPSVSDICRYPDPWILLPSLVTGISAVSSLTQSLTVVGIYAPNSARDACQKDYQRDVHLEFNNFKFNIATLNSMLHPFRITAILPNMSYGSDCYLQFFSFSYDEHGMLILNCRCIVHNTIALRPVNCI